MRLAPLALAWSSLVLMVLPTLAQACQAPATQVFSCTTTRSKVVEVCDAGSTLSYTFGKPGSTPELALNVPRQQASTYQWEGFGRTINHRVSIPNGNTVYTVFTSFDKMRPDEGLDSGVDVHVNGKLLTTVSCKPASLRETLEGIDLKRTEDS